MNQREKSENIIIKNKFIFLQKCFHKLIKHKNESVITASMLFSKYLQSTYAYNGGC